MPLRELRRAAVGVEALEHADVQVAAHDEPRRGVVVVDELAVARDHGADGGRELAERARPSSASSGRRASRKAVPAGELLDEHLPAVMSTFSTISSWVKKVHHGRFMKTRLRLQERTVGRLQPLDDEVFDLERAVAEDDAQLADVHRAIEELRALLLGDLLQPRPEVDGEPRDDHRGDERDQTERAQDGADESGCGRVAASPVRRRRAPASAPPAAPVSDLCQVRPTSIGVIRVRGSFDDHQHAPGLDRGAGGHGDVLDASGLRRAQLVLHLHRFDDDDGLARARPRRPAATSTRTTRPGIGRDDLLLAVRPGAACRRRPRPVRRPLTAPATFRPREVREHLAGRAGRARAGTRTPSCAASGNSSDTPDSPLRCASTTRGDAVDRDAVAVVTAGALDRHGAAAAVQLNFEGQR